MRHRYCRENLKPVAAIPAEILVGDRRAPFSGQFKAASTDSERNSRSATSGESGMGTTIPDNERGNARSRPRRRTRYFGTNRYLSMPECEFSVIAESSSRNSSRMSASAVSMPLAVVYREPRLVRTRFLTTIVRERRGFLVEFAAVAHPCPLTA